MPFYSGIEGFYSAWRIYSGRLADILARVPIHDRMPSMQNIQAQVGGSSIIITGRKKEERERKKRREKERKEEEERKEEKGRRRKKEEE